MEYRFTKQNRLLTKNDYRKVFADAKKYKKNGIWVFTQKNLLSIARLGIIIARREIPKSVSRNRFKRLIRESFREHKAHLVGYDIIVMVKKQCGNLENKEFCEYLNFIWRSFGSFPDMPVLP